MNKWDIGQEVLKQDYTEVAIKCNQLGDRHIAQEENKFFVRANVPHTPTIQEQIEQLENSITTRNIRCAIQGDEFALNKISQVEAQIEELRKEL